MSVTQNAPQQASGPRHIAFIMDGNGRWAQSRGLPRLEGHRQGVHALKRILKALGEMGIGYATFYAFSSENWKRPIAEVAGLMNLLRVFINHELEELAANNVRLLFIGDRSADGRLDADILALMEKAEKRTAQNTGLVALVCLNYGGRAELVQAAKRLAQDVKDGAIDVDKVDEDTFSSYLYTKDIPDPDLCIRSSGEQRLSNFLPWQLAYAELVFAPQHWPDFNRDILQALLADYHQRERRFGGLPQAPDHAKVSDQHLKGNTYA